MPKANLKSKTISNRPAQRRLRVQRVVRHPATMTAKLKVDVRDAYHEIYIHKGTVVTAEKHNEWRTAWRVPYGFIVDRSALTRMPNVDLNHGEDTKHGT